MLKTNIDAVTFIKQGITRHKELIPHEECLELAYKVQAGLDLIESLGLRRRYDTEAYKVLGCDRTFEQGLKARNKLVVGNMRFALSKAHYFSKQANRQDQEFFADFAQAANAKLPMAVEKFDPTKGYRITTFLAFYIREAVFFERKKQCMSSLKVSMPLLQIKATLAGRIEKLTLELGRSPTQQELAASFNVSVNRFQKALAIPSEVSIFSTRASSEHSGSAPVMLLDELESKVIERDASQSLYEHLVDEYGEPGYHLFQQFMFSGVFNKIKLGIPLDAGELETVDRLIKVLKL